MLHYKIYGSGAPVVILHGLFGTLDNWRTFAKLLEADYQVVAVDLRNHGKSFWSEDISYDLMAADVAQLLESLDINKAHFVGHSMGGKVVMTLAQQHPPLFKKGVIVDIANKTYEAGHLEIFEAIFALDLDALEGRKEADEALALRIPSFAVRQFILKSLARKPEGGYRWKTNFEALYAHYQHILSEVPLEKGLSIPMLFVKGSKSGYIGPAEEALIEDTFTEVSIKTLNTGHWIHAEQPKELYDALTSFFKE